MKRTFTIHITLKDGKLTYSMELDRDNTRCHHQSWQEDGSLHIRNTWERDPTFLERIGRKVSGWVAKVRAV